jgi:cytochrome c biogenesis protein CcdA
MFGLSNVVLGVLAIVAGLLILVFPDLLRWIVGIFLIVWGILTMLGKKQ